MNLSFTNIKNYIKCSNILIMFGVFSTSSIYAISDNDYKNSNWVNTYDVQWNKPAERLIDNMPLVGGDIGCNVWVEKGDLLFYVQRSGSFNEIGEYIKLGRIRLTLDPNPLKSPVKFDQELILKDGCITVKAKGKDGSEANIKLWVDRITHSVNLTVDSPEPISYKVSYENWRTKDISLVEEQENIDKYKIGTCRFGSFAYVLAPFEVIKLKDEGLKFDKNSVLFYHKNPEETMSPNFGIKQQGLEKYKDKLNNVIKNRTSGGRLFASNAVVDSTSEGSYLGIEHKALTLKSKSPSTKHHIFVATHIAQEKDINDWVADLNKSCSQILKSKGNFEENQSWWKDFWQRSWIVVDPDNKDEKSSTWQIGRNYNLMRYQFGGSGYGEFPVKFNGGSVTWGEISKYSPDWRKWGGDFFTGQNQRLLYWPMLKSGDFDMMDPQFELYMKALPGATARVKECFGHDGAAFSENTDASGIHIPFCYGWNIENTKRKDARGIEIPFGDKRVTAHLTGGRPVEKGVMINASVAYYYHLQLEFAYMIMQRYLYTGESFEKYMPFISAAVKFYDEHYQKRKILRDGSPLDENGKLVIYPSQACEAYKGVKNPVDGISGLKACLEMLINIDQPYITKEQKQYYKEFLARVPELPYGELDGHRVMGAAEGVVKASWKTGEIPMFYPLFPYNRVTLLDKDISAFHNVWKYNDSYRKEAGGWSQVGIFLARMGLADEAIEFHKIKLGDNKRFRFPTYWGPNYDGIPDYNHGGSGMIGLQEMLMQTFGKKIILFPAWKKGLDVDFKLHAPYKTTVEVSYKNGKIEKLIVSPKSRMKDIIKTPLL